MALSLDFDAVEIDERQAVGIFGPGNPNDKRLFYSDQLRMPGRRFPFTGDVRAKSLAAEKLLKRGYRILVCAIPVLTEIVAFEELLEPDDPLRLHTGQ